MEGRGYSDVCGREGWHYFMNEGWGLSFVVKDVDMSWFVLTIINTEEE